MLIQRKPLLLIVLIAVQGLCAIFFLSDVVADSFDTDGVFALNVHLVIELVATVGLIFGIVFETRYLVELLRRSARLERNMQIATGALSQVIEDYFREWGLTPAEKDVALFTLKGMSNAEIADLRKSSEGTIKAHLNAVFRKADVSGRNQLLSILVEDLMSRSLLSGDKTRS